MNFTGSTEKPVDMYRIIEHFSLGRRRLELFGEDHNIRPGWVTVGKDISSSYFNAEAYISNFSDENGNVWQGGGGRNPPPGAPHLVETTPLIVSPSQIPTSQESTTAAIATEQLLSISLTQNPTQNAPASAALGLTNQEASSSTASLVPPPAQWTPPPPPDMMMMMMMGVVPPPPENAYGSSAQTTAQHIDFGPLHTL